MNVKDFLKVKDNYRHYKLMRKGSPYVATYTIASPFPKLVGKRLEISPYYSLAIDDIQKLVPVNEYMIGSGTVYLGCDPEFFFTDSSNKVVPSTQIVEPNEEGVIIDGFQGELNPRADSCRQRHACQIACGITLAQRMAKEKKATVNLMKMGVVIDDDVWKKTPLSLKKFGCSPTLSAYDENHKRVTGLREKFRAGGGHIHLGFTGHKEDLKEIVKLMDITAGLVSVLLDRDTDNVRRRKNYGRAGEYRAKSYGVEYRVPSNFWLRHYVLMSLMFAQVRTAFTLFTRNHTKELLTLCPEDMVRKAINENDFNLALELFTRYINWLKENGYEVPSGLSPYNYDEFTDLLFNGDIYQEIGATTNAKCLDMWKDATTDLGLGFEGYIVGRETGCNNFNYKRSN